MTFKKITALLWKTQDWKRVEDRIEHTHTGIWFYPDYGGICFRQNGFEEIYQPGCLTWFALQFWITRLNLKVK